MTYFATDWWEACKATIREEAARMMTWPTLKVHFLEKYFPELENDKREQEFIALVQSNMTISDYTLQFERLTPFLSNLVDISEKKIKRYQ